MFSLDYAALITFGNIQVNLKWSDNSKNGSPVQFAMVKILLANGKF